MPIGPIQYLPQQPNPFDIAARGLQLGESIRGIRQRRSQAEEAAKLKEQYSFDLQETFKDPTPENIAKLTVKYPGQREAFKQGFGGLSEEQQKNEILQANQVYHALINDNTDVAQSIIDEQIVATENSGKDTTKLKSIKRQIDINPKGAAGYVGSFIAGIMGVKEFAKTYETYGKEKREEELRPSKLTASEAKAQTAAVKADFAESEVAIDITKKGWDIAKIQSDIGIAKENAKIATAKLAQSKITDVNKARELDIKIKDMETKRDEKARKVVADAESGMSSIDNILNSTERFFNTSDEVIADATGPIGSRLMTLDEDTADFEELIETMGSQAFMAMIPAMKGAGALSDAEGKKLATSLQSLSLRQSPKRLKANVKEIQRILTKSRANLATKYGVPETIPDTPAAELTTPEIDALLLKYGGE